MRRTWGIATVAVLAAGTLGAQAGTAAAASPDADTPHRGPARAAIAALENHPGAARAVAGQAFAAAGTLTDGDGSTHVRVERTFHGLPVLGGDMVVHRGASGAWQGVSQTLRAPVEVPTTATVAAARARGLALAPAHATRGISGLRAAGHPTLVVDATSGSPRLAWQVLTAGRRADGTPSRLETYVDARTGDVLRREERIQTVDGQGRTLYSGTVPLSVTGSGTSYQLKNDGVRGGTYTTDMKNKSDGFGCQLFGFGCSAGTQVTSSSTTFGSGTNSDRASAAADAQYGSNETWDYYEQTFGRDGIFGNGQGSYNRVHYGNGYVNAFWDGSKMTYGDGDGTDFGPLVSLDVAGHEMSHGVTENSANLTYSGESGGLNEATSDIFGTMVEFFAGNASDPGDYLIGEQFDLKNHLGFRRMDQPSRGDGSLDCWSSSAGDVDVHYSSGIGNHFFYLLSEGSGAKTLNGVSYDSPTCDGSTVTGIGRDTAADIWYRALTVYMTSSTDYHGARTATLNAAKDLYGSGSSQYAAVAAAWSAVGVS